MKIQNSKPQPLAKGRTPFGAKWILDDPTGTQIKLLASEMIPKEFYTYFGSHMSSDHGRSHFSPIAKWGSNNFFQNISFIKKNQCFSYFYENYVQKEGHYTYILTLESNRVWN